MSKNKTIDTKLIRSVSQLANIPISDKEAVSLANAFNETLEIVNRLQTINTTNIEPTHQVTGLENRLREDKVNQNQSFTQKEALANASKTYKGYFVVPRIIDREV